MCLCITISFQDDAQKVLCISINLIHSDLKISLFPPSFEMYQAHIQLNSLHERQSRPQTHLCQEGQPRHLPSVSQLSLVLFLGCLSRDKPITHCFPLPGNGESGTLHNTRFSRKALLYKISPKFQRVLSQHARVACTQMHVLKLIHSIITTRSSL